MAEPEKNEHSEEQFDDLSLEELLRGAREEIARVDAMMGNPADEPVQEPDAVDALDAAGISKMQPWVRQQITVPYALFERAKLLIAAQEGTVEDAQYGADILITYRIPEGADERLRTALREASSGSVVPSLLEEIFCAC